MTAQPRPTPTPEQVAAAVARISPAVEAYVARVMEKERQAAQHNTALTKGAAVPRQKRTATR